MTTATQLNLGGMGRLYPAVLDQSRVWRDGRGLVRPLDELDRSHLERLEPFLLRHGERLREKWLFLQCRRHSARGPRVIGTIDGKDVEDWGPGGVGFSLFSDNGGNMDAAFDDWWEWEMSRPLAEWLADRPLVKRIRELLAQ